MVNSLRNLRWLKFVLMLNVSIRHFDIMEDVFEIIKKLIV